MNRVFLAANVLFFAAWREGAGLLRLWQLPETALLTSYYAAEEARCNLNNDEQRERLRRLMEAVRLVNDGMQGKLPDCVQLPDKDRPILLAAIQARVSHLLTGDKQHFGPLYGLEVAGVIILRPGDYPAVAP
jgi:hypothetical protein